MKSLSYVLVIVLLFGGFFGCSNPCKSSSVTVTNYINSIQLLKNNQETSQTSFLLKLDLTQEKVSGLTGSFFYEAQACSPVVKETLKHKVMQLVIKDQLTSMEYTDQVSYKLFDNNITTNAIELLKNWNKGEYLQYNIKVELPANVPKTLQLKAQIYLENGEIIESKILEVVGK
jgi:hypothetical protein